MGASTWTPGSAALRGFAMQMSASASNAGSMSPSSRRCAVTITDVFQPNRSRGHDVFGDHRTDADPVEHQQVGLLSMDWLSKSIRLSGQAGCNRMDSTFLGTFCIRFAFVNNDNFHRGTDLKILSVVKDAC